MGGVSSTGMLCKGVLKYIREKELNIGLDVIDIPKKRLLRPEFQRLIKFLAAALDKDMPVAFLNLHNGKVKELDSWHWVTIISLEYDESQAYADILDEGMLKKIDLTEWFNTTIIGGGCQLQPAVKVKIILRTGDSESYFLLNFILQL